jgi:hypothetical protein
MVEGGVDTSEGVRNRNPRDNTVVTEWGIQEESKYHN